MTSKQINFILTELGFSANAIIDLQPVSEIVLTSNENLYPENTVRFNFNTTSELLYVYHGTVDDKLNFNLGKSPKFIIDFSQIEGFILSGPLFQKTPYKWGAQV